MTKPSAFDKKRLQQAVLDDKRGFLDELHLPPEVVSFLRKNARSLIIGGICFILMFVGWVVYKNYSKTKNDEAAAALVTAEQETDEASRIQAIDQVVNHYPRTTAALWAKLELAHIDYQAGNYKVAVEKYKAVRNNLTTDNALVPLITYSIGQSYEQLRDNDNALEQYRSLSRMPGFAGEGYLGMARIYEEKKEFNKAREVYEDYLAFAGENKTSDRGDKIRALVEDKLARLKDLTGPEENAKKDQ
jgi:predicted negative regulator of RcsB-dependent stress response